MLTQRSLLLLLAASLILVYNAKAQSLLSSPVSSPVSSPASSPAFSLTPAPAPGGLDCADALLNLSACLTFVEVGSNLTVPEEGCCPSLAALVVGKPPCLCQLLGSGEVFGVQIDTVKSLKLPSACRIQTPPVSLCALLGIPVPSQLVPAPAPTDGSSLTPGSSPSPGGSSDTKLNIKAIIITLATMELMFISFF